jgi:hypothetical protein
METRDFSNFADACKSVALIGARPVAASELLKLV